MPVSIHKILIVGEDAVDWCAPAWHRTLTELGMDVRYFSYTSWWPAGIRGRIEKRVMWGPTVSRINRAVLKQTRDYNPDVILLYAAYPIWSSTVKQLASRHWVTTYHNDNPFGEFGARAYFRHFRHSLLVAQSHHVFREVNVDDYRNAGVERVKLLHSFYRPWIDQPPSLSPEDCTNLGHDIVFVGHGEPDARVGFVRAIVEAGLPLKLYSAEHEWKRSLPPELFDRLKPMPRLVGDAYREVISASKICLCFLSRGNHDQYTVRVFEIPAIGGFLLCERTPVMQGLYEEDYEAVYFSSEEELVDKCRFYLAHDALRQQIARAGHLRCINSGYDVFSRMRQWVTDLEQWMDCP